MIERFGSQLCTSDIMRTVDRSGGYITGPLFLAKRGGPLSPRHVQHTVQILLLESANLRHDRHRTGDTYGVGR